MLFVQLQAFRMQQESREGLQFLLTEVEDSPHEPVNIQALKAETVLELQKTRNLLLLEHRISKDLQVREDRPEADLIQLELPPVTHWSIAILTSRKSLTQSARRWREKERRARED